MSAMSVRGLGDLGRSERDVLADTNNLSLLDGVHPRSDGEPVYSPQGELSCSEGRFGVDDLTRVM